MLDVVRFIFVTTEMILFFPNLIVNMVNYIDWFSNIKQFFISSIKLHLVMMSYLFLRLCCFIWFAKITFITFASVFISNICLQFYFLAVFFVFCVRIILASQNVLESIIYFPIFWKSLYRISVISLLIIGLAQKFIWVFCKMLRTFGPI